VARKALAARAGVLVGSGLTTAVEAVLTDPGVTKATGRLRPLATTAAGFGVGCCNWIFDGRGIEVRPELTDRSRPVAADPREREATRAGRSIRPVGAEVGATSGAESAAETGEKPSSPGAAAAIPGVVVPLSATPRAKAAAPARARHLLADIGIPRAR